MRTLPDIRERIEKAFEPTAQVVLGLVDQLLDLACEHELTFEWREGRCHVRARGGAATDEFELSLPQSVFRAALARIAVLCNECGCTSTSIYGGEGQLAVGAALLQVEFANRPGEQRLKVGTR